MDQCRLWPISLLDDGCRHHRYRLILMGAGYHAGLTSVAAFVLKPIENLLGGLAMVSPYSHIFTWLFILFIVAHIYMAFWYDAMLKQGTVSSMIGGIKFTKTKE